MFSTPTALTLRLSASLVALSLAVPAAQAQDTEISFSFGAGLKYAPVYEGSDEYGVGPTITGGLNSLSLGGMSLGGGDGLGFSVAPSFGFVGARDAGEYSELKGFDDIDWALEVGVKLGYTWEYADVSAAVRRGFNGHEGVVGDLAANAIIRPDDRTTLRFGPRMTFANDEYAETYFSVPASATKLGRYNADGGLKSYGLEAVFHRELSDDWAIEGKLGWARLTDDFADSPITSAGRENQGSVSVTLIRAFNWRF
ncbi:MAG: MipA/OmpV family protein [Rhodobacteraceae bacterium]|nr:MAG: MipA/OmpV family protein [Paracoccaceae bacterium]